MFGNKLQVSLYRYNPEEDKFPYMKKYTINKPCLLYTSDAADE